ncbi:hypothetical protein SLS54_003072 [Diplodia seriata]
MNSWKKHEEAQWKKHEQRQWKESESGPIITEVDGQEDAERITETYSMRMVRIQMALNRARAVVKCYCSLGGPEPSGGDHSGPGKAEKDLFDLVSLSLIALGETLTNAKVKIVDQVGSKIRGWNDDTAEGWGTSKLIKEKLEKEWCPKTLHVLEGQFRGNTTGLLAAYTLDLFEDEDHRNCREDTCMLAHVKDDDSYELRHSRFCTGDDCALVGTDPEALQTIINRGAIPLLRLENNASRIIISVTDSFECKDYATVSHVWSDGYGNPKENKLHQCQLAFLKEALNSVERGRGNNDKVAFWMDTLAIPVGDDFKEARKMAIGKIHETFVRSRYTLVLDQGLCKEVKGENYHKTAMMILASGWMRRLWTLQEAYLSEKIFFKFMDETLELEELEAMYPAANDTLTSCLPAIARSYFHSLLGTARKARIHDMTPKEGLSLIASVWKATQWRTTTHKQHEVLALATLFNLNTDRSDDAKSLNQAFIAGENSDEQLDKNMCTLLRLLEEVYPGSIPAGIIFLPGKRLPVKGYGWAPRTWISGQTVDHPDPLSIDTPGTRFVPDQGLYVEFPGFLLHSSSGTNPITRMEQHTLLRFPVDSTLTEWYEIRRADIVKGNELPRQVVKGSSGRKRYAIILLRQRPRDVREIALLVETRQPVIQRSFDNKKETHILRVSIMFRVWINKASTDAAKDDISNFYGKSKQGVHSQQVNGGNISARGEGSGAIGKQVFAEILDHDQKWCVDQDQDLIDPSEDQVSEPTGQRPRGTTQSDLSALLRPTKLKKAPDDSDRHSERAEGVMSGVKKAFTWSMNK